MMNKPRTWIVFICLFVVIMGGMAKIGMATEIEPRADAEFALTSTTLKSSKDVSFRCVTYDTKSQLSVVACWLEKKNTDGSWFFVCSMTPPSTVYTNTSAYSVSKSYSSYIGKGTYRVWATYDADGHRISRCSNEQTY